MWWRRESEEDPGGRGVGAPGRAHRQPGAGSREPGAGSRILPDAELTKAGIEPRRVRGYDPVALGHLPAAWHVVSGLANCCMATEAAARAFGLRFLPIVSERSDLVIPQKSSSSTLDDTAGDGPIQHLGEGELRLEKGDLVAVAGSAVSSGEGVREQPQHLRNRLSIFLGTQAIADGLQASRMLTAKDAIVEGFEADAFLLQLLLGVCMPVRQSFALYGK